MKTPWCIALAVVHIAACAPAPSTVSAQPLLASASDADYEVYSTVLGDADLNSAPHGQPVTTYAVAEQTRTWYDAEYWKFSNKKSDFEKAWLLPGASRETLDDFIAAHASRRDLEADRFVARLPVRLVTADVERELESDIKIYWNVFRERFPESTGLIQFSRVGYRSDGRQALVIMDRSYGPWAAEGDLVLLERSDGHWVVAEHARIWGA